MTQDPLLLEIPAQLETERLFLRAPRPGDGSLLNAAVLDSFDEVYQWMYWTNTRPSLEESEHHVREACAKWMLRMGFQYFVFERGSENLVASVSLRDIRWDLPKLECGYWCRTPYCGKGFTTEAVQAVSRMVFDHLHVKRLVISCDPDNVASRKIPEKLGFQLEGILRQARLKPHSHVLGDTCLYARVDGKGL